MPETTLPSRTVFERGLRHLPGRQMCLWEVVSEPQVGTSSRISKTEGVFIKINSMTNPFVERSRVKVNEDSSVTSLNLSVLRLTADTSPAQWAVPATLRVHTWGAGGCGCSGLREAVMVSRRGHWEGAVVGRLLWVHPAGSVGTSRSQSWKDVGTQEQLDEILRCEPLGLHCDS